MTLQVTLSGDMRCSAQFVESSVDVNDKTLPGKDTDHFSMDLFPNPAEHLLNVSVNIVNVCLLELRFYDMEGSLIKKTQTELLGPGNHIISNDISDVPAGIYTLQVNTWSPASGNDEHTQTQFSRIFFHL